MIIEGKDLNNCVIGTTDNKCPARFYDDKGNRIVKISIMDSLIDKYIAERDAKYYLHVLPGLKGYLNVESYEDDPTTEYVLDENDETEPDSEDYIDFWAIAERVE